MTLDGEDDPAAQLPRPQSLMFSFLGIYVLHRGVAVYSGSVIDVFARLNVSEEAVRSTLARMVKRNLLTRHRRGRKVYFGLTPHAADVLKDGRRRVWETGAVNRDWDGTWTLVGFSLPDSRRSTRHDLRSQLIWNGFGLLQNGLWIAPGEKDVTDLIASLELGDHVTVLTAGAFKPTETADLVRKAFDIERIAGRYRAFLTQWDVPRPLPDAPDDLARQLLLHTDWLQLVRQDPHLPAEHLPPDWPAIRAEQVFQTLAREYETRAAEHAAAILDELPV
ncbi:PaaX family transcriptional regulator [Nonomuraea glycinis]|uniref:PaaX family transcriptional regulator n=1 Tax=Nonomuraea glycinis TaxID=2047744 RepID=A0A918EA33_9ACTN|nr:PaaX family transcriptional regulator C-terminal domain-containing protein [Nonomuraea glycinis]MCA2183255.1 PaaX family transcriptional regulator [Nonomuraea glycinis]WSG65500.1 PaaX family transcriptional regulator [Nonomuraea glycinis]GGP18257.1 PaaX family transcriptional regulator [Nonomuraea glycinis]